MASLETFVQDLRVGIRGLRKRPGFTAAALLTLALGIGANAAVFSVLNGVLLAPLPYHDAANVVVIWNKWVNFDKTWIADAEIRSYGEEVTSFEDVGGWSVGQANLTGNGDAARVGAALITPNLLTVLGADPLIGRNFTEAEAQASPANVVILSHALWQQRFGGRQDILGRGIDIDGIRREIVGVMPAAFQLPTDYVQDAEQPTRLWLPLRLTGGNDGHGYHAAGRLRPGASLDAANAELAAAHKRAHQDDGQAAEAQQFTAFGVRATDEAFGSVRTPIFLLVAAVGCLMLIACANVANLLLVRADARSREMALRAALGAERGRLIRQMLTESAALAFAAAVAGIAIAWVSLQALQTVDLTDVPRASGITLDVRVLVFSFVLSSITLVLFSLAPALRAARADINETMKEGALNTTAGGHRQRTRGLLVAAETALAVALLSGALLMMKSIWNLQNIDLGLDPSDTLTMSVAVPRVEYDTPEKLIGFYRQVVESARGLPGVEAAGAVRVLPLAQEIGDSGLSVEGYTPPPGLGTPGDWQVATDGAIAALGERIVRGREFRASDVTGSQQVALVNEALAAKYFAGRDALGGRFKQGGGGNPAMNPNPWITVVGIVADVRHNGITGAVKPKFYRPHSQFHESRRATPANMTLVVRTGGSDPLALAGPIRDAIRRIDPDVPVAAVRTMDDVVASSIATPRLTGWLLGVFASLALLLAAIGIYSVLSYVVSQRRREIGIRLAMGASTRQVVGLIWRGGLAVTAAGAAAGMIVAAVVTRAMASLLYGVTPLDPVTFIAAPLLLMIVASIASFIPALRATRVDPVTALRAE